MRLTPPTLACLLASRLVATEPSTGFDAGLSVTLETSAGLHGGAEQGHATQALTIGHVGWQQRSGDSGFDLQAYASVLNHAGDGPTERYLGDFLAASNMEAYSSTRLYTWWFELAHGGTSLRAGALLADEEFTGTSAGGELINSAFGWPAFISANTVNTGPAFYAAAIGVRMAQTLTPALTWRTGLYDGDTFDSADGNPHLNRHGTHYRLGGAQGWFVISELAWAPAESPTRWKLGAWHHTADFADQYFDADGQPFALSGAAPRQHAGDFGAYVAVERTLRGTEGQAGYTDAFIRFGAAPSDRNAISWAVDAGVSVLGLIPGRSEDTLALDVTCAEFSHRYAATARLLNPTAAPCDAEQVVELAYTFALGGHLSCKPDFQYIRHPGGSADFNDAKVVALRLIAEF